nr:MAG TPA: hypothetical protein [Caudoviricetes sp.]
MDFRKPNFGDIFGPKSRIRHGSKNNHMPICDACSASLIAG